MPQSYEIPIHDVTYQDGNKLGAGGFGTVYRGEWSGREVAIKVLMCRVHQDMAKAFQDELKVMLELRSPQVIQTYGAVLTDNVNALVMELMPNGNLYDLLRKQKDLPWERKYRIALDVAYGLKYLHDRSIIHRDLKSLNVLLDRDYQAKLCDFGLAKVKTESSSRATTKREGGGVGTVLWMAPELFGRKGVCSPSSDIYAMAMVMYELLTHDVPFGSELQGKDPNAVIPMWVRMDESRPEFPEKLSSSQEAEFRALIEQSWVQDPSQRLELGKLIEGLKSLVGASRPGSRASSRSSTKTPSTPTKASGALLSSQAGFGDVLASFPQGGGLVSTQAAFGDMMVSSPQGGSPKKASPSRQPGGPRLFAQGKRASKPSTPAIPHLNQQEVDAFVQLVLDGEQDEADAMLKQNPALALGKGKGTEKSGRKWQGITGFQFALWALDWRMWVMIRGHMEKAGYGDHVKSQFDAQEALSNQQGHGAHFDSEPLQKAYKKLVGLLYLDNVDQWDRDQIEACFLKEIGGAQRLLPVHVAQEYCTPDRPFDPVPDFSAASITRAVESWWFVDLGSEEGAARLCAPDMCVLLSDLMCFLGCWRMSDGEAVAELFRCRNAQLEALQTEMAAVASSSMAP